MSTNKLYPKIKELLAEHIDPAVDEHSLERIALLVTGVIEAKSAAPAQIAKALKTLGLSEAQVESIERRVRRIENDPEIRASYCFHPLARQRLVFGKPQQLLLIIDPTTQDERVVMLTISVWYRGRALPLAWAVWPGNQPLRGDGFWARVKKLIAVVKGLLPLRVPVTWLADRAFGSPAFTDLLDEPHWDYVVRVQNHTRCRTGHGLERQIKELVPVRERRSKLRGLVFKKRGWRQASVVAYWGRRHQGPLCLVSSLHPRWSIISLYRRRYPIEATFRDYKTHGWQWERGQVTDLEHIERLLVAMALATWLAVMTGTQVAAELLAIKPTGQRRTTPWVGKRSLFALGLQRLEQWLHGECQTKLAWYLSDWDAPNWQAQIHAHHANAFVFASPNLNYAHLLKIL